MLFINSRTYGNIENTKYKVLENKNKIMIKLKLENKYYRNYKSNPCVILMASKSVSFILSIDR